MSETIERPADCTRRRAKPFVDSCGCEWCKEMDDVLMGRDQPEKHDDGTGVG